MTRIITGLFALAAALSLVACGGRASLDEESGRAYRRVIAAQADAQPAKRLSALSADDAKIILENHLATYGQSKGKSGGAARTGGLSGGGSGQLTPETSDFGSDNAPRRNDRNIKLQ